MNTPPSRTAIRDCWDDVLAGRRTREEVNEWAVQQIEAGLWEEELVLQGLLRLNTLPVLGEADVRESLERWTADLAEYDENPQAWDRAYFLRMLREFTQSRGADAGARFAGKLVSDGLLTSLDVREVLGD